MTPYEEIFKTLNDHNVKYIVVGGMAVVLHGHLRTTADIDLVLALDSKNILDAIRALKSLDYQPRAPVAFEEFAQEKKRAEWIKEKDLTIFSTYSARFPGIEIDLFASEPFDFSTVFARVIQVPLEKTKVPVASIDDLIEMKKKVGRAIDLADVSVLESIKAAKEKNR